MALSLNKLACTATTAVSNAVAKELSAGAAILLPEAEAIQKISKENLIKSLYIDKEGKSELINRYELPDGLKWTSGDGPFRNDFALGKIYKMFRFSPKLNFNNQHSVCWQLTDEDIKMITHIHGNISFKKQKGSEVEYIKFFGIGEKVIDKGIADWIRKEICKLPCAHCCSTKEIQCDHKNDLKNDPRVVNDLSTQTIDDFQPLCRKCNITKSRAKTDMLNTGKRYSATNLGYLVDFTYGDEKLDKSDPKWYIGTYWGDCNDFKKKLVLKKL